ncbi:hypothetical protein GGH13_009456, partial [Coemansia sp. S155-1]
MEVVYDTQFIDARSSALAPTGILANSAADHSLDLLRSPTSLLPHWPEQDVSTLLTATSLDLGITPCSQQQADGNSRRDD